MAAIAYAQFRRKMEKIVEDMIHLGEPVTITRADGKNFVIVPQGEWDAINATTHLMSNEGNIRRLRESAKQAKVGKLVERAID